MSEQIWAITMVRNEEDMIGPILRHMVAQGVDHILVANNLSKDGTNAQLEKLAAELPLEITQDDEPAYRQGEKMTALAHRAGAHGATWIIPFDADELWLSPGSRLREYFLSLVNADVVIGDWYHHYAPIVRTRSDIFSAMARRDTLPDKLPKVAFRYRPDISLAMGNHAVRCDEELRQIHDGGLEVHHYRYRSFKQMIRKSRQGRQAVMLAGLRPETCLHWRLHGSRSSPRLAVTWVRMAMRRRGRVYDPRSPSF